MNLRLIVSILAVAPLVTACGTGETSDESATDRGANAGNYATPGNDSEPYDPVEKTVDDGPGGEAECGALGTGGPPPDFGDILTVSVDYDGEDTVVLDITFAGDALAKIAETGGTKYTGYVQSEIGTAYPFRARPGGDFENSPNSLADSFAVEWTSGSEAEIRISGFEEDGGPIVRAGLDTQSATQDAPDEVWCDEVVVEL